jgi:ATP-binding cassette subfamily B protein
VPAETPHDDFENVREQFDDNAMSRTLPYLRPYWARLVGGSISAVVMRGAQLVPVFVIAAAIDRVITATVGGPGLLADLGLLTSTAIPAEATQLRIQLLTKLTLIAAAAYIVQAIAQFATRYLFMTTAQHLQHDLRAETYDHMQRLSMDFFNDHQTGAMMSILNSDINRLENFFKGEIRMIIRAIVMFLGAGAYMFYLAPKLAPVALAAFVIIALATGKFIKWIEPKYKRIRELVAILNTRLANNLGGPAVIKSFDRYPIELERVVDRSRAYRDEKIEAIRIRRTFFSSLRLLVGGTFVFVLLLGGRAAIAGNISTGTFAVFFMLLMRLDGPLQRIGKTANKYHKTKASAERVFGILATEPSVSSPEGPHTPTEVRGDVTFEDVGFGYDGSEESVVDGISYDVRAGTTVGLAGTSGSGKSTLLKLLSRFHDVDEGAIRIDDVDIREYDPRSLRDAIGVVEQNPYMFAGTIRDNIAYGDRELFSQLYREGGLDESGQERIREAARAAGAHGFINVLPEGYDTQVGERGVKLSGGQRQRVSIARVLLNDPAIVVLDEATSDVDTETEEIIQENLDRLCEDRTAFVIAHRLSTIQAADRILVMEDGKIVETGSHEELINEEGNYASLWNSQSDGTVAAMSR